MSGINYYPSRKEEKIQSVKTLSSTTALSYSDSSFLYECINSSPIYIHISSNLNNAAPVGTKFDILRLNGDVGIENLNYGSLYITSSVGATPKIRAAGGACTIIKVTFELWVVVGDIVAS